MDVFEGYSVNKGMVLASVAKVRFDFGIPSLMPQRLRALGERLANSEDGYVEAEQVVLMAEKLPITLVASIIPGIEVIGLAIAGYLNDAEIAALDSLLPTATTGMAGRPSKGDDTFPIVGGLGDGVVRDIEEGEIVLVDGNGGRVFIAPDAFIVARFQSSTARKRYFLEGSHLPAKTASSNRLVPVLARAANIEEIAAAMDAGADGIYLDAANELLSDTARLTAAGQVRMMHEIMDLAGGKPIVLDIPSTAIAYSALLETTASAPVSMALETADGIAELAAALEMTRMFADPEAQLGDPSLLLAPPSPGDAGTLPANLDGIDGFLLRDPWHAYGIEFIIPLLGLAQHAEKTVYAALTVDWRGEIEDIVQFGVNGLIVSAAHAADVKDAIREL